MLTDQELLALCVWTEARGEPLHESRVAIGLVVKNRIDLKYASDGTMAGTVLRYDQFSAFYFDMVDGKYERVCENAAQAAIRAEALFFTAAKQPIWADCLVAAGEAMTGPLGFVPGPQMAKLIAQPKTVLYANLAISKPVWADPANEVCVIGAHTFFHS